MNQKIKNRWWSKLPGWTPIWFFMESREFMAGYPWYKVYVPMPWVYVKYLWSWIKGN